MCTAVTYQTRDFYFGRTLDYEFTYPHEITVTPRHFPLRLRHMDTLEQHYAMIGMAYVAQGQPLYFDAVNEKGLAMAGLNFVKNAHYHEPVSGQDNVAHFELITWVLAQCASVQEAKTLLFGANITGVPFSKELAPSRLHWIVADRREAITVEAVKEGLRIDENPVGVLTNDPPFHQQLFQLNHYMGLSAKPPCNRFSDRLELQAYSRGMGALGLPGDLSSQSRFVRAAFVKMNSVSGETEEESVSQFFHILGAVEQQRGCCDVGGGEFEITQYTACCNADKGIYYYTTYENRQITAVDMHRCDLDGSSLTRYVPITEQKLRWQN